MIEVFGERKRFPWEAVTDTSRSIPWEIADAVTMWGRKIGRDAVIRWIAHMQCAVIELACRADDPKMQAYRDGKTSYEPKEVIPLHRHDPVRGAYFAIDLEQLGSTGLIEMLEQADVSSGRGEHATLYHAWQAVDKQNEKARADQQYIVDQAAREAAWLHRRDVMELPLVSVGVDLTETADTPTSPAADTPQGEAE